MHIVPEKGCFEQVTYVIIVCVLMPFERKRLQFYDLKEIYHIYIQNGFFCFCNIKTIIYIFWRFELSLVPFKDSREMAIIHSCLFKANRKFITEKGGEQRKARAYGKFSNSTKMGIMRNGMEDHGSYHDLHLHWECASKLGGSLLDKDSVSEQPTPH